MKLNQYGWHAAPNDKTKNWFYIYRNSIIKGWVLYTSKNDRWELRIGSNAVDLYNNHPLCIWNNRPSHEEAIAVMKKYNESI